MVLPTNVITPIELSGCQSLVTVDSFTDSSSDIPYSPTDVGLVVIETYYFIILQWWNCLFLYLRLFGLLR